MRGRIVPEHKNPIKRFLIWVYRPAITGALKAKTLTIVLTLAALVISVWLARRIHAEPAEAAEILQTQNHIIKTFPEVESVYGKVAGAETATDPTPTEMVATIINRRPRKQWRAGLTTDGVVAELDEALQFPEASNAWTMPINARTDMLATGIRTPIDIKVLGFCCAIATRE